MTLTLRELRPEDEAAARELQAEFKEEDFDFLLVEGEWDEIMSYHANAEAGIYPTEGLVPASFLVAEVDGVIVGRVSIRHELNDYLATIGGHIGYGVGKEYRRRGYATEILRQSLEMLRVMGVDRALVTCVDDNIGSIKTIEACGGELQDKVGREGEELTRRYWIDLA